MRTRIRIGGRGMARVRSSRLASVMKLFRSMLLMAPPVRPE